MDSKGPGRFLNCPILPRWLRSPLQGSAFQLSRQKPFVSLVPLWMEGKWKHSALGWRCLDLPAKPLGLEGEPVGLAGCVRSDVRLEHRSMRQDEERWRTELWCAEENTVAQHPGRTGNPLPKGRKCVQTPRTVKSGLCFIWEFGLGFLRQFYNLSIKN